MSLFFQAEDGIRDGTVTGVQTCALPISPAAAPARAAAPAARRASAAAPAPAPTARWAAPRAARSAPAGSDDHQIGRASCRGRGLISVAAGLCNGNDLIGC